MGPCQVQPRVGRGDQNEDIEWVLREFIKQESFATFKAKFNKLDAAEKAELTAIFTDQDVGELLNDQFEVENYINSEEYPEKKELVNKLRAWMDAHPMEIEQAEIDAAIASMN